MGTGVPMKDRVLVFAGLIPVVVSTAWVPAVHLVQTAGVKL